MSKPRLEEKYQARFDSHLKVLAAKLSTHISDNFQGVPRIDRISARAKTPARFLEKALTRERGKAKYTDPLNQIQDQIGARITTFYLGDVEDASKVVERYYRNIESRELIPDSESEFGYVGKHYVLFIPEDVFPDDADRINLPTFFELQVKTLFQHAWSEAGHDLVYKSLQPLTSLQKRQVAFTAAQSWGADQIFGELFKVMQPSSQAPGKQNTVTGG
jgi:putative GTP pyrophosphokinase